MSPPPPTESAGSGRDLALRRVYALSLSLALAAAYLAANAARFRAEPWWAVGFAVWGLLALAPWFRAGHTPLASFSDLLRLASMGNPESPVYRVAARFVFLIAVPSVLGLLAMYAEHQLAVLLRLYLFILMLIGALGQEDHDGMLVNMVVVIGLVFLASLAFSPLAAALVAVAAAAMMHAITAYLLELNYPRAGRRLALHLSRLALRRNLLTFVVAGSLAFGGSALLHGAGRAARSWFIEPVTAGSLAPGEDLSVLALLRLLAYILLAFIAAFFVVRVIAGLWRDRRRLKAVPMPRGADATSPEGEGHPEYGINSQWDGTRKQVIAIYLRTRNQLARLGYELRISATPGEYTDFVGRRLQGVEPDLAALTAIFEHARYADRPPVPDAVEQARQLQGRVLAAARGTRA